MIQKTIVFALIVASVIYLWKKFSRQFKKSNGCEKCACTDSKESLNKKI